MVYAHAVNGALAQSGRLTHLNVGTWADTGANPEPTESTVKALIDWCYAALTYAGLKGRRVVVFRPRLDGHGDGPGPRDPHSANVRPGNHSDWT